MSVKDYKKLVSINIVPLKEKSLIHKLTITFVKYLTVSKFF